MLNNSLLEKLAHLIIAILKSEAPVVEKAAVAGALETAASDPKVAAVTETTLALLEAAQDLKEATSAAPPQASK